MSSLRDMASSLKPSQAKNAIMETYIGNDISRHSPNWNSQSAAVEDTDRIASSKQLEDDELERDEELGKR
jgi:hypothetical protein